MFTGTIEAQSHEGGLLVHFEGSSPALNAVVVRAEDGTYIGKVDGVLGSTEHPLAHVAHVDRDLNLGDLIGIAVTVRAKKPREPFAGSPRSEGRQRSDSRHDRQGREGRGQRGRDDRRGTNRSSNGQRHDRSSHREGNEDWTCPACNNSNFARRDACNRCQAPRPSGGRPQQRGGRHRSDDRSSRSTNQGTFNNNDWTCPSCNNSNFSFREHCNRCEAPRPGGGGGGGRGPRDRGGGGRGPRDRGGGNRNDGNRGRSGDGGGRGFSDRRNRNDGNRGRSGDGGGRGFADRRNRNDEGGKREGASRGDADRSSSSVRKPSGTHYRKARGKRPGHAHNQEPRDFRTPRKFDRKRDD